MGLMWGQVGSGGGEVRGHVGVPCSVGASGTSQRSLHTSPFTVRSTGRSSGSSSPPTPHILTGPPPASEPHSLLGIPQRGGCGGELSRGWWLRLSNVSPSSMARGRLAPISLAAGLSPAETWSDAPVGAGEAQTLFCV